MHEVTLIWALLAAVAAIVGVARRIAIPYPGFLAVLEGESLINDAVSLVAYRMAIIAAITGQFSLGKGILQFLEVGAGGTVLGLAVGWAVVRLRDRLDIEPSVENLISLLTPFAAYLPPDRLGLSGVLAVVAAGLYIGRRTPRIVSARTRLQSQAMWEMLTFVVNGLLFILTGMQIKIILQSETAAMLPAIVGYSAATVATLLAVRFLWVIAFTLLPPLFNSDTKKRRRPSWTQTFLIGWTGIRGALSLVTALAIPLTLSNATPFPQRNMIISITFCVILITLVLQGWTLPWVATRLRFTPDRSAEEEETLARLEASRAALRHLDALARKKVGERERKPGDGTALPAMDDDRLEDLRNLYRERVERFTARSDGKGSDQLEQGAKAYRQVLRDLVNLKRETILRLRAGAYR
ncbi:MAG: hypothetical protein JWL77_280 [Chthonomonadaceae bacterium]|nr:hypothetical protein [Chthonomonadaceae bacterium]